MMRFEPGHTRTEIAHRRFEAVKTGVVAGVHSRNYSSTENASAQRFAYDELEEITAAAVERVRANATIDWVRVPEHEILPPRQLVSEMLG
jgi:hypothetical protein